MTGSKKSILNPTVALSCGIVAVLVAMVLPLPAWLLDIGLAASFALAILILTITLFVERPLDFSSFPTALLVTLLLRLSLTVASTKLIISQGHTGTDAAGHVIEGFANFVMGGSVLLGAVIFCVIMIVNFMVITKGAARMAEVGARFALDAMPGKQLAIDADMASGAIDHAEARMRREREQAETTFFGSLDGASKFVKGDAIAGLLITILNFVVGLISGCLLQGMALGDALQTYTILTVGDGLVTQIPAVIISVATALLLARGGQTGQTDSVLRSQFGRQAEPLAAVSGLMVLLAFVPGLPAVPFLAAGGGLGVWAWRIWQKSKAAPSATIVSPDATPAQKSLGEIMDVDDIHVEFAADLVEMVLSPATGLDARISSLRHHIAVEYGLLLPEIRLTDSSALPAGSYVIMIHGAEQARAVLRPAQVLALLSQQTPDLEGEDVREPVYGAPARWIAAQNKEQAALQGVTTVQPAEVLATHLMEVVKRNFPRLLTHRALRRRLDEMVNIADRSRADGMRRFLDELIPEKVPMDLLLSVLRLLLEERVSIRNMPLIIEALAEARGQNLSVEAMTEQVRQRLGFQLVAQLRREDGSIPLVQLAPEWEDIFASYQIGTDRTLPDVALPPEDFNRLAKALAEKFNTLSDAAMMPALVTSGRRRRFLRHLMAAKGLSNPVLSFEEIGLDARPALLGVVDA